MLSKRNHNKQLVPPIAEEQESILIEEPILKSTINIDAIRNEYLSSAQQHKNQKLQIALDYTQREFAPMFRIKI